MMKRILVLVCIVVVAASCRSKYGGDFSVNGKIDNATGTKIYLTELPFDVSGTKQPIILDSTTLKNGSFELKGLAKSEGIYSISLENGPSFTLVNDSKEIRLNADLNQYKQYKTEGSPASTALHQFYDSYMPEYQKALALNKQVDSMQKMEVSDSIMTIINLQFQSQLGKLKDAVLGFINNSASPAASLHVFSIGSSLPNISAAETRRIVDDAVKKFKGYQGFEQLQMFLIAREKKAAEAAKQKPPYALMNQQAPEISLPSLNGDTVRLSSFKGKYVLVDFWASWCGPCRNENPNVVAAHSKYKNRNFTILGVSLDDDKKAWQNAVKQDSLSWTHVSDLKRWESSMVGLYQLRSIPFNILVDPDGKIIAYDLREDALDKKLAEVLK
jgi:peroxiredoxin